MVEGRALELRSLCKVYRRRGRSVPGLCPLSLDVDRGEAVALVGPNGSGKTTAIKIAATLVDPTSGGARVFGHDVMKEPRAVRAAIGVSLTSARSFYWRLSALHNLLFFAATQGVPRRTARERVERLSVRLGLSRLLHLPARRLSRGALARLAIARALVHDPALLLLDEPFASLDDDGCELAWSEFEHRLASGCAALVASHDPQQICRCGRQVALSVCQ